MEKLKRILRISGMVCALGWAIFGSYQLGSFDQGRTLVAHAEAATTTMEVATKGKTVTQMQDEALTMLSYGCEVKGVPANEQEGKITFDSNHKPSTGLFQFQQGTVISYVKRRDNKDINFSESNILSSTKADAWELARWIAFTSGTGTVSDWTNCSNKEFTVGSEKVQLRDYIAFINSLSAV